MKEHSNQELPPKATSHRCSLYRFNHRTERNADGETVHVYDTIAIYEGDERCIPLGFASAIKGKVSPDMTKVMAKAKAPPDVFEKLTHADVATLAVKHGIAPAELQTAIGTGGKPEMGRDENRVIIF